MIEMIKKREGKAFEIQMYDDSGNASVVFRTDTVEELAQILARCCWGMSLGANLPTIWKDGKKWCAGEYTPVSAEPAEKNKLRVPLSPGPDDKSATLLVAEVNPDPMHKEIWIYLEKEEEGGPHNVIWQDIACIGEKHALPGNSGPVPVPGTTTVRVYADAYDEDYTDCFDVETYDPFDSRSTDIPDSQKL